MRLLLREIDRAFLVLVILARWCLAVRGHSFTWIVIVNCLLVMIFINWKLYFLFAMSVYFGLRSSNNIFRNIPLGLCIVNKRVGPELVSSNFNIIQIRCFWTALNQRGVALLKMRWGSTGLSNSIVMWWNHSKRFVFKGVKIGTFGLVIVVVIQVTIAQLEARLGEERIVNRTVDFL